MKRIKYILTVASFALVIFGLALWHVLLPDADVSKSERRKLAQAPQVSVDALFDREFSDEFETYMLDQFPLREGFRQINAAFRFYILRQLDSNGIWIDDGVVFKTDPVTNDTQIKYAAQLYNSVIESFLDGCNVYYSIIPDKSYFAQDKGYPHLDYARLIEIMNENVAGAQYIDITDTLDISKYYRTDTHWLQPRLFDTMDRLGDAMGIGEFLTAESDYTSHTLSPFYGVYLGQAALPIAPDEIEYLTSSYTESAVVSGPEYDYGGVYVTDKFDGMDGYDVFLGGTQALVTIECPDARTDRELYIFRDSFGSSIAPLFTGAYSKITVIDLRYITSQFLPNYVEFTPGSDVLFLNSTQVLNTAMVMR